MQDHSKDDPKADETEDDLAADVQDAIRASLLASFEQDTQYQRLLSHAHSGTTGENVASDEATTRVEHLHEHVSLGIVHEGVLNAGVDSDPGMAPHEPFYLDDDEPHDLHDHYSAFLGCPHPGDGTNVQSTDGGEDEAKLPAVSDVAASEALLDNHHDLPLPDFVGVPYASLQSESGADGLGEDTTYEYFHDSSAPDGTLDARQTSSFYAESYVFVDTSVEQAAWQIQGQPGTDFDDLNRRRPSESPFPDSRAVRQRVGHFQPTSEELEEAQRANPRAVRDLYAWYDHLNELLDYSIVNGNCSVPQHDANKNHHPLGVWVAKQRSQRVKFEASRRSSMTSRRVELLDSVGFDWGTRRGDAAWTHRYNELLDFYRENGHSNYPTRTGPNRRLGRFVTEQRRLHRLWRQGLLLGEDLQRFIERMPLLERIQFRWAMQGVEAGNADVSGQVQDETDSSSGEDDGDDEEEQV